MIITRDTGIASFIEEIAESHVQDAIKQAIQHASRRVRRETVRGMLSLPFTSRESLMVTILLFYEIPFRVLKRQK